MNRLVVGRTWTWCTVTGDLVEECQHCHDRGPSQSCAYCVVFDIDYDRGIVTLSSWRSQSS